MNADEMNSTCRCHMTANTSIFSAGPLAEKVRCWNCATRGPVPAFDFKWQYKW